MKRVLLGVVLALVVSACDTGPDGSASAACRHYANVLRDIGDGLLEIPEIRTKFQEVLDSAQYSEEPGIASSARAIVASLTGAIDTDAYGDALAGMTQACVNAGAEGWG